MPDLLLGAGRVVTPAQVFAPGWLRVVGDQIVEVAAGVPPTPPELDLPEETLVPGFVDAHVHGGGGASFSTGTAEAAGVAAAAHLACGTTSMMASLVTDTVERLGEIVTTLADLVGTGTIVGIHLEGPWLSRLHRGAHDPTRLRDPASDDIETLLTAGRGTVRMVTLAPELPHGVVAVRQLAEAGVLVAIGHTDATYEQARAALEAGASVGTHLFNAMRAVHHREPGPVLALLEDDDAYVELVADGVHLHPAVIRHVASTKPHHTVLVTDAMAAAASADGDYQLGPMAVRVSDGVARLVSDGAIAGSTLTMAAAVKYAATEGGLALEQAVRAATMTPAMMLGLHGVGQLRPGYRADIVSLDAALDVRRVLRAGRWVDPPGAPIPT